MTQKRTISLWLILGLFIGIAGSGVAFASHPAIPSRELSAAVQPAVAFIENVGQFDARARFLVWGAASNSQLWVAEDALWLVVQEAQPVPDINSQQMPEPPDQVALRIGFAGASPAGRLEPIERLATTFSYMIGNDPSAWRSQVPLYAGVRFRDLYPGVNLELAGGKDGLTWHWIATDPQAVAAAAPVKLTIEGAQGVAVEGNALVLHTALGAARLPLPITPFPLALESAGNTLSLPATEQPEAQLADSPQALGEGLMYGTFLGTSAPDFAWGMVTGTDGYIYVTGYTSSMNFPVSAGQVYKGGGSDAIISKLTPKGMGAGVGLAASIFFGGNSEDWGQDIDLDATGVYVTGRTDSNNMPTTVAAYDRIHNGDFDVFLTKLPFSLNASPLYSTYIGGGYADYGRAIKVESGLVYITGDTKFGPYENEFPTIRRPIPGGFGGWDVFVLKLDTTKTGSEGLVYSTVMGGEGDDGGRAVEINGNYIYFAGFVTEGEGFPRVAITDTDPIEERTPYDMDYNGGVSDAFVVQITPNRYGEATILYSSYIGGAEEDAAYGMKVHNGVMYVTGHTFSPFFPVTDNVYDSTYNGESDVFLLRLDPLGFGLDDLLYSSFLGGVTGYDVPSDIAIVDDAVWITGNTSSTDFPTTADAYSVQLVGVQDRDAFLVHFSPLANGEYDLVYSSYFGGSGYELATQISADSRGAVVIAGYTESINLPTTVNCYDSAHNGAQDIFIAVFFEEVARMGANLPLVFRP